MKLNQKFFSRTALALSLCTILSACGTLTGIPSHGGGKRFATEQRLVSASIRAALKDIDVSALYGKKAAIVFDLVHDEGGGSLDGGRLSLTGALSRGLLMSPGTTTSSAFQIFDLVDSASNYSNSAFTGSNSATSTFVGTGAATSTGQSASAGNSASNTTTANSSNGSSSSNSSSASNGANNSSFNTSSTGSTSNTNGATGSNNSTETTTGTFPAVTTTAGGFTQTSNAIGTSGNTASGTNNTTTSNNITASSASNGSSSSAGSVSTTGSGSSASNSQNNSNSNSNSSTTQNSNTNNTNNQAGGSNTNRQVLSNQPTNIQVNNSGYKTEGNVGLAYKGLGEYHNFNVPKSDASLLMGLVRSYLLLNGITPTTPTDQSAEVLLYVTVDIFGIIRQRSDFYVYNEENVKAETSFEISAYDRKGKLIMSPTTANREARYKERYIAWAGPFATEETLHEGKGLMVDFSDLPERTAARLKAKEQGKEQNKVQDKELNKDKDKEPTIKTTATGETK